MKSMPPGCSGPQADTVPYPSVARNRVAIPSGLVCRERQRLRYWRTRYLRRAAAMQPTKGPNAEENSGQSESHQGDEPPLQKAGTEVYRARGVRNLGHGQRDHEDREPAAHQSEDVAGEVRRDRELDHQDEGE